MDKNEQKIVMRTIHNIDYVGMLCMSANIPITFSLFIHILEYYIAKIKCEMNKDPNQMVFDFVKEIK